MFKSAATKYSALHIYWNCFFFQKNTSSYLHIKHELNPFCILANCKRRSRNQWAATYRMIKCHRFFFSNKAKSPPWSLQYDWWCVIFNRNHFERSCVQLPSGHFEIHFIETPLTLTKFPTENIPEKCKCQKNDNGFIFLNKRYKLNIVKTKAHLSIIISLESKSMFVFFCLSIIWSNFKYRYWRDLIFNFIE